MSATAFSRCAWRATRVVHLGALELAAGHPDHAVVPGQGGVGRVRVGGFGIIDGDNALVIAIRNIP